MVRFPLPCPEDPRRLAGAPIGMYHCPCCGEMQIAGMRHTPLDIDEWEAMTGEKWFNWSDDGIWP